MLLPTFFGQQKTFNHLGRSTKTPGQAIESERHLMSIGSIKRPLTARLGVSPSPS